jgi:hypothetical protein
MPWKSYAIIITKGSFRRIGPGTSAANLSHAVMLDAYPWYCNHNPNLKVFVEIRTSYFLGNVLSISSKTAFKAATSVLAVVSKLRVAFGCAGSFTAQ